MEEYRKWHCNFDFNTYNLFIILKQEALIKIERHIFTVKHHYLIHCIDEKEPSYHLEP